MINQKRLLEILNKYNCYNISFDNTTLDKFCFDDLIKRSDKNSLLSQINKNSVVVILAENFFVIPKLALLKWGYFNAIINNWSEKQDVINNCYIIDITRLFIDFIQENKNYNYNLIHQLPKVMKIGMSDSIYNEFIENYHNFLELLIPP